MLLPSYLVSIHTRNIQWISKTSFYAIQKAFAGVVNNDFHTHVKHYIRRNKNNGSYNLIADGRCDSLVHNAKY